MITSHPTDARYFASRAEARAAAGPGERVVRLGVFAAGSFGCWPRMKENGIYVGQDGANGQPPRVVVWMVAPKETGR